MSMLAERRRKTKWVINPTKKPVWTTDSNGIKFGKELMEKMGWSAGKGLGANEQGIQEPLKVSYKNDTKGMGFKGNDDDWIEQQDEFNVLLSQLRSSDDSSVVKIADEKNEIKSLEKKSKQSRARVHYQKFTRGKDLSRYSENDLACILGTNKTKKEKTKTEEVVENNIKTDCNFETSFGVTTINSGSIQDYFKRKWVNDKSQTDKTSSADKENSFENENQGFSTEGLKPESNEMLKEQPCNETNMLDYDENCKKKKKKRKKKDDTVEEEEPKIKRRKRNSNGDNGFEEIQGHLDENANNETMESEILSFANENGCDSLKKKKKEKKHSKINEVECLEENNGGFCGVNESENCNNASDLVEVQKKKKKKKEKKENGCYDVEEVPSVDCIIDPCSKVECMEGEVESGKRKKKKVKNEEVFDDLNKENIEEVSSGKVNDVVAGENDVDDKPKKKKKKKKCKDHDAEVEETVANLEEINDEDDTCRKHKKKKKKKEKEIKEEECDGHQNGISSDITAEKSDCNQTSEVELCEKKKKKDKHKTKEKNGDHIEESCLDASKDAQTVQKKKKKKDKKEKQECKDESSLNQQKDESGEHCPEDKAQEVESVKKKKKKEEVPVGDENKEENGKAEVKNTGKDTLLQNGVGNAQVGTTGLDKVELIQQRAAYEHIPGQHAYERVKSMIQWVNYTKFKGSNLEALDGYGQRLRSAR